MSAFHSERGSSWGRVSPAVIFLEWRTADQDHFMTWSSALRPLRSEQVRSGSGCKSHSVLEQGIQGSGGGRESMGSGPRAKKDQNSSNSVMSSGENEKEAKGKVDS